MTSLLWGVSKQRRANGDKNWGVEKRRIERDGKQIFGFKGFLFFFLGSAVYT